MSNLDKEELLSLWLEGRLTPETRIQFESLLVSDSEFSARVNAASQFQIAAEDYQEEKVPQWSYDKIIETEQKRPWWQWNGLPVFSSVCSAFAIVMVLTNAQIKTDENGLTVNFNAQPQTEADIARLVEQKVSEIQQVQQQQLIALMQTNQQQQLQANSQLTSYLLDSSRKERREDFAELIKFINEQRADDQLFVARQLNKIQQDLAVE